MSCLAQRTSADEYEIRAAMLFNLTKFIQWPGWKMDDSHLSFSVCILGSDPLGPQLDSFLRNKTVGTKPVIVRHLSSIENSYTCHILYVSGRERNAVSHVSEELARNAVLTVSERSNVDSPVQIIGLPSVEERVRIDVNLGVAVRSGLVVSSRLLHLATVTN